MGPLISAGQRETVSLVRRRRRAGRDPRQRTGRARATGSPPTVLCPVDPRRARAREEIFGPVATVIPFDDEDEAVRLANDTIYGLSGSIWTRDGARALRVARAIDTGVLSINSNTSVRVRDPVRRLQAVGLRPRARPARARRLHRGQVDLLRDVMSGRLRRQGLRDHRRGRRDRRGDRRAVRARGRPGRRRRPASSTAIGELSLQADLTDEEAVARLYARVARGARPDRRAVQQRRHLADRRRLGARHLARGVGARAGREPAQRLPVLQARDPPPARRPAAAR